MVYDSYSYEYKSIILISLLHKMIIVPYCPQPALVTNKDKFQSKEIKSKQQCVDTQYVFLLARVVYLSKKRPCARLLTRIE